MVSDINDYFLYLVLLYNDKSELNCLICENKVKLKHLSILFFCPFCSRKKCPDTQMTVKSMWVNWVTVLGKMIWKIRLAIMDHSATFGSPGIHQGK